MGPLISVSQEVGHSCMSTCDLVGAFLHGIGDETVVHLYQELLYKNS